MSLSEKKNSLLSPDFTTLITIPQSINDLTFMLAFPREIFSSAIISSAESASGDIKSKDLSHYTVYAPILT